MGGVVDGVALSQQLLQALLAVVLQQRAAGLVVRALQLAA